MAVKKKSKMGRPTIPKSKARGEVIALRLRPDEARQVNLAVRISGLKKPDWMREALMSAATNAQRKFQKESLLKHPRGEGGNDSK